MGVSAPETLPEIVIPVFNARQELAACLASLDRNCPNARVVVIDDASTDPEVLPLLESWSRLSDERILLKNERNRGFVHSANRGMTHCQGDVVLLNSDTVTTPGWLQALAQCLASDQRIATATPWTNNGEIVSFPGFCVASPPPDDPDGIAAIIRRVMSPCYPEIPTAVGFCMAISRRSIDACGLFDEDRFGKGYGEENDFSMRVRQAGFRNVLCDNAYVVHLGGRSFAETGIVPGPGSMRRLLERHPAYEALVSEFISADPLSGLRSGLAEAVRAASGPVR